LRKAAETESYSYAMIFDKKPESLRIVKLEESLRMFREVWIDFFELPLEELHVHHNEFIADRISNATAPLT
jgi:hypothetical protein